MGDFRQVLKLVLQSALAFERSCSPFL